MITHKERLRHQTIKFKLNVAGKSLAGIARALELAPNTVQAVSSGRAKSMRVAEALADAIEVDVQDLFPEYFETFDGNQENNSM